MNKHPLKNSRERGFRYSQKKYGWVTILSISPEFIGCDIIVIQPYCLKSISAYICSKFMKITKE